VAIRSARSLLCLTQEHLLGVRESGRSEDERTREPMTQQKCDHRTKVQGHRKGAVTRRVESVGGASAATVNEQALQLGLCFGTAENPKGSVGEAAVGLPATATRAEPKPRYKKQSATSATMEEVCERLTQARGPQAY